MGKVTRNPCISTRDHAIRSKLLNRLGIYKSLAVKTGEKRKHVLRSLSIMPQPAELFKLPLNDSYENCIDSPRPAFEVDEKHPLAASPPSMVSPTSSLDGSFSSSERTIQFNSEVLVMPIPSRHEYSSRIKKFLWNDAEELSNQVERNRLEFEAEGWSLEGVLEEDDMYIDANSGELVHPIWLEGDLYIDDDDEIMLDDGESAQTPRLRRTPSFSANLEQLGE